MKGKKNKKRFQRSQLDLISELPQGVIETILVKLPIEDAVRTSILSSRWRYKWASMPDIVFDDDFALGYSENDAHNRIVKFISRLLFLHDGPIRKFSLSSSHLQGTPESDICQWLLFVSRKDVKEVVIGVGFVEEDSFKVPSCLFSCKNLTRLELFQCEVYPPPNFEGFPSLKSLWLQEVLVSQDKLESLISSSHLLDDLTLSDIVMIDIGSVYLTVCAPNLKHLFLEGNFMELTLANTPLLVDLSVALDMDGDIKRVFKDTNFCYYERILGGVPNLERLEGRYYFTAYMSSLPVESLQRKPIVFSHLKSLELYDVDFYESKEVLVTVQIITTCPNLQDLQISAASGHYNDESGYLNSGDWVEAELLNLKTVKFTNLNGATATYEMEFIEYLLESSPALQQMRISPSLVLSTEIKLKTAIDLMAFRRASTIASVVFCDGTEPNETYS